MTPYEILAASVMLTFVSAAFYIVFWTRQQERKQAKKQ
jgi:preprotein translocase subunit YajC